MGMLKAFLVGIALACFVSSSAVASSRVNVCLDADFNDVSQSELEATINACTSAMEEQGSSSEETGALYRQRGMAYRFANDLDSSLDDLQQSVVKDPNSPFNMRMLGWTLREMRRLDEALAVYGKAIAMKREFQSFLSRCDIYMAQEKWDLARSDCETSLSFDRNPDSLFMMPKIFSRLGLDEKAIPLLEEAIARPDSEARAYVLLSCIYTRNNQVANSERVMKAGVSKFPLEYLTVRLRMSCDTERVS